MTEPTSTFGLRDRLRENSALPLSLAQSRCNCTATNRLADDELLSATMNGPLPTDAPELTAQWLTSVLREPFSGVDVAAVTVIGRSASTNLHLRLAVTYNAQAGSPDSLFVKLPPLDAPHRQMVSAAAMGAREVGFYQNLAPGLALRVPACYFAEARPDGSFLLLLEDLGTARFRVSDGTWAPAGSLAPRALEELAAMHVAFENPNALALVAPWAPPAPVSDRRPLLSLLHDVLNAHAAELSAAYVEVGQLYVSNQARIDELWAWGPQSFLHGDPHVGNVFVEGERIGFFDWGMATIGHVMKEVSYFLTMGLDLDDRTTNQRALLDHYLRARQTCGGSALSFDEAWETHRLLAGYNVIASFLGLTPPYNKPERLVFSSNFRRRAMQSLDDLDTVAALRSALA